MNVALVESTLQVSTLSYYFRFNSFIIVVAMVCIHK